MLKSCRRENAWRHVCLTLAAVAVAMKVFVPAGFMTAPTRGGDMPFALVLCTAQGAVTVESGAPLPGQDGKASRAGHDNPCAFSGHGTAGPAPNLLDFVLAEFVAYRMPAAPTRVAVLAPGRGLAAPPLPARGPPLLLI